MKRIVYSQIELARVVVHKNEVACSIARVNKQFTIGDRENVIVIIVLCTGAQVHRLVDIAYALSPPTRTN